MPKIGTAGLFFAAALTFLVTMLLVEFVAQPGAQGALQTFNYLVVVLLLVSFGLLFVACSRVGRRDWIGPLSLEQGRSFAWPACLFILGLVALGLCAGLCSVGSKFGAPETFSFMHDSEAWLGIASFLASGLFLLRSIDSLVDVLIYRWKTRRQ